MSLGSGFRTAFPAMVDLVPRFRGFSNGLPREKMSEEFVTVNRRGPTWTKTVHGLHALRNRSYSYSGFPGGLNPQFVLNALCRCECGLAHPFDVNPTPKPGAAQQMPSCTRFIFVPVGNWVWRTMWAMWNKSISLKYHVQHLLCKNVQNMFQHSQCLCKQLTKLHAKSISLLHAQKAKGPLGGHQLVVLQQPKLANSWFSHNVDVRKMDCVLKCPLEAGSKGLRSISKNTQQCYECKTGVWIFQHFLSVYSVYWSRLYSSWHLHMLHNCNIVQPLQPLCQCDNLELREPAVRVGQKTVALSPQEPCTVQLRNDIRKELRNDISVMYLNSKLAKGSRTARRSLYLVQVSLFCAVEWVMFICY